MAPEALDELEAKLDPAARFVVATLRDENAQQRKQLDANVEQLRVLADQIVILTEQVADLNRRLFGRRAEKNPTVREEIRRAIDTNELTVDGEPMPAEPKARAKEKRRKARRESESERQSRRLGKKKALPVIVETREVEAERLPAGYTLEDFRELGDGKVVERYEHVHEHLVIQRYILQALVSKDGEHIITAAAPPGVVDGGLYGPGLHAHMAVSRCDDGMPRCRTEKTLSRAGTPIARSTLCSLFHRTAEQLKPLYDEMKRSVRRSQYVHADETGQPVLDKAKCHRGWMWLILSQQAIVYHYSEGRGSDTAKALLGETAGNVTVDGYSGYNCLTAGKVNRVRSGCWGHLRRKAFEAMTKDAKNHENLKVLGLIAELYKIEDEARDRGVEGSGEHLALRQIRSRKIVTSIW
jgi:transposase